MGTMRSILAQRPGFCVFVVSRTTPAVMTVPPTVGFLLPSLTEKSNRNACAERHENANEGR